MGLDVSHGCWSAPYSKFHRFRHGIAHVLGIPLDLMDGFYERPSAESMEWIAPREGGPRCADWKGPALHHWVEKATAGLPISWDGLRPDPIHKLLHHSDCEGVITPADAGPIADRLLAIAPMLAEVEDFQERAERFARGLKAAADAGETVTFG